jgi:uncharacterized membrane protein
VSDGLALVVAAALVTYATRLAGLVLAARLASRAEGGRGGPWAALDAVLAHVPVAAFAALIAPDLDLGGPEMLPRLAGAAVAAAVVLRAGALWAGLGAGMAAYWAASALIG